MTRLEAATERQRAARARSRLLFAGLAGFAVLLYVLTLLRIAG
jgi:hypothetical protein